MAAGWGVIRQEPFPARVLLPSEGQVREALAPEAGPSTSWQPLRSAAQTQPGGNWFQSGLCHLACEPRFPIGHRGGANPPDCCLPGRVRLDPISSPHYRFCEWLWHYLYFSRA